MTPGNITSVSSVQSKRKRGKKRKNQNASASAEPDSLLEAASVPGGVSWPANSCFQNPALPQSGAPQGGLTSEPSQPPGAAPMPPEGGDHPGPMGHAEAGGSPPRDKTGGGAPVNGKGHDTPKPSKGRAPPQEGAGPTTSASKDRPGKEGAAQEVLPPEPKRAYEPRMEPQSPAQQTGAHTSGVSCREVMNGSTVPGPLAVAKQLCRRLPAQEGHPWDLLPGMTPLPEPLVPLAGLVAALTCPRQVVAWVLTSGAFVSSRKPLLQPNPLSPWEGLGKKQKPRLRKRNSHRQAPLLPQSSTR